MRTYLILISTLYGRYYDPHFTDTETKAQKLRSLHKVSKLEGSMGQRFRPMHPVSGAHILNAT